MEFEEWIGNIYRHIPEAVSKEIYANRLLYSLTGDLEYMLRIISGTSEGRLSENLA